MNMRSDQRRCARTMTRPSLPTACLPMLALLALVVLLALLAHPAEGQIGKLHLNLKDDYELQPLTPPDREAGSRELLVEAEYTEILTFRNNKQWVEIGTWASEARELDLNLSLETANIWISIVQEAGYDAEADFIWTVFVDGSEVEQDFFSFADPDDEEIYEVTGSTDPFPVTVARDESLEVRLEYAGYEDIRFYYDNATHDSGVLGEFDFLQAWDLEARDDEISLDLHDIFGSDWSKATAYFEVTRDNTAIDVDTIDTQTGGSHVINDTRVTSTRFTWTLAEEFEGGENVQVWLKYTLAETDEDKGFKLDTVATAPPPKRPHARIERIDPNPADEGNEVTLDGSASYDEDGTIETYVWESDLDGELYNGSQSSFHTPSLSVGEHVITLRVADDEGLWSQPETETLVIEELDNEPPEIEQIYPSDRATVCGSRVDLSWLADDPDGDILVYTVHLAPEGEALSVWQTDLSQTHLLLTNLTPGGEYRWRVDAWDDHDLVASEEWSFSLAKPGSKGDGGIRTDLELFYGDHTGLIGIAALTMMLGACTTTVWSSERGRWNLYCGLFIPLLSRIRSRELEEPDKFKAGQLFQVIMMNPGINLKALKELTGIKNGTLIYHLDRLEREGLIKSTKQGHLRLFHSAREEMADERYNRLRYLRETQMRVLNFIYSNPDSSQKDLSLMLQMNLQVISYHLRELLRNGFINRHGLRRFYTYSVEEGVMGQMDLMMDVDW